MKKCPLVVVVLFTVACGNGEVPMPTQAPTPTLDPTQTPTQTQAVAPTALPVAKGRAGICGRTPEVQEPLIGTLGIPSCQVINADELYRVRALAVDGRSVAPGDFADLPNLREMAIYSLQSPLKPGTFAGLSSLERLHISTSGPESVTPHEWPLPPGILADLPSLQHLEINQNNGWTTLRVGPDTLTGLRKLQSMNLNYVDSIPDGALDSLLSLETLNLHSKAGYSDSVAKPDLARAFLK